VTPFFFIDVQYHTMENPLSFKPGKPITVLGHLFGSPLAIQSANWFPLSQLLVWTIFTWGSVKSHPSWSGFQHLFLGGMRMVVMLGSEWCHNLAHVVAARQVGKPVDTIRIFLGMPILLYDEPEHPSITPRQHVIRSVAGPICNAVLLLVSKIFQHRIPFTSPAREIVDTAVGMNTFIAAGSWVPVPVFDGGPILKWSLIGIGYAPGKANAITTQVVKIAGAGLIGSAVVAIKKKRWLPALILVLLGFLSLVTGFGKKKD
jgi:Zn-dependent protease